MGNLDLLGKDRDTWGTFDEPLNPHPDLLSVVAGANKDPFSSWCSQRFIHWFYGILWNRRKSSDDLESGIISCEDEKLQNYTSYVASVVASLLPISAIVILYCIHSMNARLGAVAVFTVICTTCLTFFTPATRGEIFIATSTWVPRFYDRLVAMTNTLNGSFAAVQVVFISTNNTNTG